MGREVAGRRCSGQRRKRGGGDYAFSFKRGMVRGRDLLIIEEGLVAESRMVIE